LVFTPDGAVADFERRAVRLLSGRVRQPRPRPRLQPAVDASEPREPDRVRVP
jgi:hypothetical protein